MSQASGLLLFDTPEGWTSHDAVAAFRRMLDEKLLPKYGDEVAFVHRDFPLAKHAWARQAAAAHSGDRP